jgi:hypothetical protein
VEKKQKEEEELLMAVQRAEMKRKKFKEVTITQ